MTLTNQTFSNFIEKNYDKKLKELKIYCNRKFNRLSKQDIEEIYHLIIAKIIENERKDKNLNVENWDGYLWIGILNEISLFNKRKLKKEIEYERLETVVDDNTTESNFKIQMNENLFNYNDKFFDEYLGINDDIYLYLKDDVINLLLSNMEPILEHKEFLILKNKIFNNLTNRQIADLIGYTIHYIYIINKNMMNKLKEHLYANKNLYFK